MERITDWQQNLAASGARIGDGGAIIDFGDHAGEARAAREAAVVVPLTDAGLITASGADAAEFLNSQFTSEVTAVSPQHVQYTGYCNPKGRLMATMLLFRDGDAFCLALPEELAVSVAQRLQKYILRAKVKLGVATADHALFGVTGPQAAAALAASAAAPSAQVFATMRNDTGTVITLPGDRYLVICRAGQASTTWRDLSSNMRPAGSNWWQLQTIRAGIATVTSVTQEAFVPQMLALDAYDAISFKKGCYPGQEIVARMHYLGDLKRRLYYGRSAHEIAAGVQIVRNDAKSAGTVVNAAANDGGEYEFLAVLQRDSVNTDFTNTDFTNTGSIKSGSDKSDSDKSDATQTAVPLSTPDGLQLSVVCAATDILAQSGQ